MEIHQGSRGTYGVPRIHAKLAADGVAVGRKRVSRLMRRAGIQGISRRRRAWTTRRDRDTRPAPDLVERDFGAPGADQLWVADITYVPTWAGFLYLAVVVDAWSRRVVGWAMANHLRTELVLDALNMALGQRRATGVIHHSDQGCQYTSIAFGLRCRKAGVQPSMGSVGDCYDNGGELWVERGNEFMELRVPGGEQYLRPGEAWGDVDTLAVQREMIRRTIRGHLDKEKRLRPQGIKVLSLFFIDAVNRYRRYDEATHWSDVPQTTKPWTQSKAEPKYSSGVLSLAVSRRA